MSRQEQGQHPLVARIEGARKTIAALREQPNNAVNTLNGELIALSDALGAARRWVTKLEAKRPGSVELALIRLDGVLKEIPRAPNHGPELEERSATMRVGLASALSQLALLGLSVVEKEEEPIDAIAQQGQKQLSDQAKAHDALVLDIRKSLDEARKAAETAKESAKKVGVTVHMTAFSVAASTHRRWAIAWAAATVLIATLMFASAYCSIKEGSGPPIPDGAWHLSANLSHYLARGLAVSLASFLLVFCTRNFRSAKHNEVVNAHRAGALATFDTLRTGAGGRVDDVVTLHVAEAVFTPQQSGYSEAEKPSTHVGELLSALKDPRQ